MAIRSGLRPSASGFEPTSSSFATGGHCTGHPFDNGDSREFMVNGITRQERHPPPVPGRNCSRRDFYRPDSRPCFLEAAAYRGSSGNVSSGCHHGLVPSVEELVEDHFSRWAGNGAGAIENDVLGTDDPRDIAEIFKSFCVRECGAGPAGCLFYLASAGCVLGVKLESGDDVVIKAYQVRCEGGYSVPSASRPSDPDP
jgi:hypothetical protein